MSTVFVAPDAQFTAADPKLMIFGGSGNERVRVTAAASLATINPNVETVDFAGAISSFTFEVTGNVVIVRQGNVVTASLVVQDDANGTRLRFADGGADLRITGLNQVTLGGVAVTTGGGGGQILPAQMGAAFNPSDPSSLPTPQPEGKAPIVNDGLMFTLAENSAVGAAIGTVLVTDPDSKSQAHKLSFSIASGNTGGGFEIEMDTGVLRVADSSALDFETSPNYTLVVKVTDNTGLSDTGEVRVDVSDANEAPILTDGRILGVQENAPNGTLLGAIEAIDPDGLPPNRTLSYSITGGNGTGVGAFLIDEDGFITVADAAQLDTALNPSFALTVKVSDAGSPSLSDTTIVTIKVGEPFDLPGVFELSKLQAGQGEAGFVLRGIDARDLSGNAVSGAGDINGDGFEDILIGALGAEIDAGHGGQGETYLVFGKATGLPAVLELSTLAAGDGGTGFVLRGADAEDELGRSVAGARDINGDGFDDLIVAAPYTFHSQSYVIYGKAADFPAVVELSSLAADGGKTGFTIFRGQKVSGAGDVNGDGYDDLILGSRSAGVGIGEGESYVVFGKAGGFPSGIDLATLELGDGKTGFALRGVDPYDFSGSAVAAAGDINGDGFDDLLVGAGGAEGDAEKMDQGESYVVFGKAAGFPAVLELSALVASDGAAGFVLRGVDANDSSGGALSGAGDINGDGLDDFLVAAARAEGDQTRAQQGETYVVFGKASGFASVFELASLQDGNGQSGFVLRGVDSRDYSGTSVAGVGDFNGDGFDDLLVGARNADVDLTKDVQGESYLVYGKASGFPAIFALSTLQNGDGTSGFVLRGVDRFDYSGSSVAGAGDVNGDGFDDLIVGASYAEGDDTRTRQGESYVVYGGNFTGAVTILGKPGTDALNGTSANESLNGGGGNDTLDGMGGKDVLIGGEGDDLLVYDAADTRVIPWLVPFLDSENQELAVWSGAAIERIISTVALKRRDFSVPDKVVLRPPMKGDSELRPFAWLALKMLQKPDDGNFRAYALSILRYLEMREFVEDFRRGTWSRHPSVSMRAWSALEELGREANGPGRELVPDSPPEKGPDFAAPLFARVWTEWGSTWVRSTGFTVETIRLMASGRFVYEYWSDASSDQPQMVGAYRQAGDKIELVPDHPIVVRVPHHRSGTGMLRSLSLSLFKKGRCYALVDREAPSDARGIASSLIFMREGPCSRDAD